jgi:hypothetical protein
VCASKTDSRFKQPGGQALALREIIGTRPPFVLSASKAIEEGEAPQSAGAETAAPGGRLAVGPVPSTERAQPENINEINEETRLCPRLCPKQLLECRYDLIDGPVSLKIAVAYFESVPFRPDAERVRALACVITETASGLGD